VAGVAKLTDREGTRQTITDFGAPSALATPLGLLLPLAELAVAVAFIPTSTAFLGASGALALLLLFGAVISYNLVRGHKPDCRCFGQIHSAPVGWKTLLRNGGLAVLAGFVIWRGWGGDVGPGVVGWAGTLSTAQVLGFLVGTLTLGLLAGQWWFLLHLMRQNGRLLVRLEALEEALASGGSLPASPNGVAASLGEGLPVGAPAPGFELPELGGGTLSLASLRASGKPILLLFTDPECGPCAPLLPEVGRWQRESAEDLVIALISRGGPEENRARADEHGLTNVGLQEDWEVSEPYGVEGTPSAVFVNPDGEIGGALAAGSEAINSLVLQVAEKPLQLPDREK
jgi:peroxiredoxin